MRNRKEAMPEEANHTGAIGFAKVVKLMLLLACADVDDEGT